MKNLYLLIRLLASVRVIANPLMGNDVGIYGAVHSQEEAHRAPDPPPAP